MEPMCPLKVLIKHTSEAYKLTFRVKSTNTDGSFVKGLSCARSFASTERTASGPQR